MDKHRAWCAVLALSAAAVASARPADDDPANPASFAPPLRFESAFAGYRPLGEDGIGRWREVNDRVRDAAAERGGPAHAQGTSPSQPGTSPRATPIGPPTGANR